MARRTLCRQDIEVTLNIQGVRSLLFVKYTGGATRFWIDTLKLEGALGGKPAEVVELDGRCKVLVNDGDSCVIYFDRQGLEQTCTFPTSYLVEALADARSA